jgi:hypothetical protein
VIFQHQPTTPVDPLRTLGELPSEISSEKLFQHQLNDWGGRLVLENALTNHNVSSEIHLQHQLATGASLSTLGGVDSLSIESFILYRPTRIR